MNYREHLLYLNVRMKTLQETQKATTYYRNHKEDNEFDVFYHKHLNLIDYLLEKEEKHLKEKITETEGLIEGATSFARDLWSRGISDFKDFGYPEKCVYDHDFVQFILTEQGPIWEEEMAAEFKAKELENTI